MPASTSVIVTGMGLVTPFGVGCDTAWDSIRQGKSAIREVTLPIPCADDDSSMIVLGGPSPELPHAESNLLQETSILHRLALAAAHEAIEDAGAGFASIPPERIGCVIGTSKPSLRCAQQLMIQDSLRVSPRVKECVENLAFNSIWPSSPSSVLAAEFNVRGPCLAPVAACATGLLSIIRGAELIQSGVCDAVIAGSVDASLLPIVVGSYRRLGILSRNEDPPSEACRPFDVHRDGFVIGEGAGIVMLMRADKLASSQQHHYGAFQAGGMLTDPYSLTQPSGASEPIETLIQQVLKTAGTSAEEIDYINLHGSATRANDTVESAAVRNMFKDHPRCSSVKGGIGHLLGAAGSVELIISLLAMRDGVLPPSINLSNVDQECELNFVGSTGETQQIQKLFKLSLGFGGHLAGAIFRRGSR